MTATWKTVFWGIYMFGGGFGTAILFIKAGWMSVQ